MPFRCENAPSHLPVYEFILPAFVSSFREDLQASSGRSVALSTFADCLSIAHGADDGERRAIREDAEYEFRAIGATANHEEHLGDQLRLHGELYSFHGRGEPAELHQRGSFPGHVHPVGHLRQSALQQYLPAGSHHKVKSPALAL